MKKYPKYKNSGVEWLGEVPEHWNVDRIKRSTLNCKNGIWGDEPKQDEFDIPCVRVADFNREVLQVVLDEPTIRNVTASEREGRVLQQNDLLLEKSGGGEVQPVGLVVLYADSKPAVCSNFVARVQIAKGMNSSYWRYSHAAAYAIRLNTRSIKQTSGIQNLDQSQYLDEYAAFPPSSEQNEIADFLEKETGKIEDLINENLRLIDLLKEKRQAVILHAVTKGIVSNAKLRPTGVEWLGEIPEHWKLRPLKYVIKMRSGGTPNKANLKYWDGSVPWASSKDLKCEALADTEDHITQKALDDDAADLVMPGSLLIVVRGMILSHSFPVTKSLVPMAINQDLKALTPTNELEVDYLAWLLRGSSAITIARMDEAAHGTKVLRLDSWTLLPVPIPPLEEQSCIVMKLLDTLATFDSLTAEAERAIELLQERRTALIFAAVTGKIDVRNEG